MFSRIRLENFRTHVDTQIDLADVTLLIGANNTGKTGLFAGIRHFSRLVARARPESSKKSPSGESASRPADEARGIAVPTSVVHSRPSAEASNATGIDDALD